MARACRLQRPGFEGPAEWTFDGEVLLLVPEGCGGEAYAIRDLSGIAGDDLTVRLRCGGSELVLTRLGADGSTLLDALRRAWLPARAEALRLTADGGAKRFSGTLLERGARAAFLLHERALLVAAEGEDVQPLFLPLLDGVAFDEAALAVRVRLAGGGEVAIGRLGGQTDEIMIALRAAHAGLATISTATLARHLPAVSSPARAMLASRWLPGRLLPLSELERLATGFRGAFERAWLPSLPRRAYAAALLEWADGEPLLGWTQADSFPAGAGAGEENDAEPEDGAESAPRESAPREPAPREPAPEDARLWLLARRGEAWLLEALSEGDRATYRFRGGEELAQLVSQLLCAPHFSREALYLPLEKLLGERSELAPAARELSFLVALRQRFAGRLIHTGLERWRKSLPA